MKAQIASEVLLENPPVLDNQYYPVEDAVQFTPDVNQAPERRYPQRQHLPPDRLQYDCHSLEERCNFG